MPTHDEPERIKNATPCCLSLCGARAFESKVGTLADQLNVICFSNISIISDSYLSKKFGIMSGTLFSLIDSGAVLSNYDDGTEYKGMSACKLPDLSFGSVDHFRWLDEDPTSPNPSSSSSLILPI